VKNVPDSRTPPNRWILLAASVLSGWNVFIIACLFSLIAQSAVISRLEVPVEPGSAREYILIALAGLFAIYIGFVVAKRVHKILKSKSGKYSHMSLFFIGFITILLLPRIYYYTFVL